MLTWIKANLATVIISAALLVIMAAIIVSIVNDKRRGKSSCGCKCASCPMSGSCHNKK